MKQRMSTGKDSDIDDDFPLIPNDHASDCEETDIDETQGAIIWWVVAFTAIFHMIPIRAVIWLLKFLWCLFTVRTVLREDICNCQDIPQYYL